MSNGMQREALRGLHPHSTVQTCCRECRAGVDILCLSLLRVCSVGCVQATTTSAVPFLGARLTCSFSTAWAKDWGRWYCTGAWWEGPCQVDAV